MPESLTYRALSGDTWSLTDHLLALVHDQLAAANWQRAAKKGRPRPKPISPLSRKPVKSGGGHGKTNEEVIALLNRYRTGQMAGS